MRRSPRRGVAHALLFSMALLLVGLLPLSLVPVYAAAPDDIGIDTSAAYRCVVGRVNNLSADANGVGAELVFNNTCDLYLSVHATPSDGATAVGADILSTMGILTPEGFVKFNGRMTTIGQQVELRAAFDLNAVALNVAFTMADLLPGSEFVKNGGAYVQALQAISQLDWITTAARELMEIRSDGDVARHVKQAVEIIAQAALTTENVALLVQHLQPLAKEVTLDTLSTLVKGYKIITAIRKVWQLGDFMLSAPNGAAVTFHARSTSPAYGALGGKVVRADDSGIPNVRVTAAVGGHSYSTLTDGTGFYLLTDLPAGAATITAQQSGLGSGQASATVRANASTPVPDIRLGGLSFALAIDSSGSMQWNDPGGLRREAAKLFIQLLGDTDEIAVVDFDSSARVIWPSGLVANARATIGATIDQRIDSYGGTNISGGLAASYRQLEGANGARRFALLLTDGQQDGAPYQPAWEQQFRDAGWPVYTFGLSRQADATLLTRIANVTGGTYTYLSVADQIASVYNQLRTRITDATLLAADTALLRTGDTHSAPVQVPVNARSVSFVVTWPGSRVDSTLRDPNGRVIDPSSAGGGVRHLRERTFEIYQIDYPLPGTWHIDAAGVDLADTGELVTFQSDMARAFEAQHLPVITTGSTGGSPSEVSPTPTRTNTPGPSPTITPSPTATHTRTATTTPSPSPSRTLIPTRTATATPQPEQDLLANLEVLDPNTAASWAIRRGLRVGDLAYGDREMSFESLPASLAGAQWVRPANNAKAFAGSTLAQVQALRPVDLYLAVDNRLGRLPWMDAGWLDSGEDLTVRESETIVRAFSLFRRHVEAGSISLGPTACTQCNMHILIARPAVPLISGLIVADTANQADWSIQGALSPGDQAFGDRATTIAELPGYLQGITWVRPANDSKASSADPLARFTLGRAADLYLAVDDRIGRLPWMDPSWVDIGEDLILQEAVTQTRVSSLYRKRFAAGEVALGPNTCAQCNLYVVLVR